MFYWPETPSAPLELTNEATDGTCAQAEAKSGHDGIDCEEIPLREAASWAAVIKAYPSPAGE